MNRSSLDSFHPLVKQWFIERFNQPLDIQERAWAQIVEGNNVLVSAPTGSGKTLTAFLWTIDRLISGNLPLGHTSVLYVSPLKALNNDIRRNLIQPLQELSRLLRTAISFSLTYGCS
jgi:ATP-dependent Lhr-like helicase